MPTTTGVNFFFDKTKPTLRDRKKLGEFIQELFKKRGRKIISLNYIFCTDKELLSINKQYLKHDYFTDIITFDLSDGKELFADIYISVDRVRENAGTFGETIKKELHRTIFHGALHLYGFNDKTKLQKANMRKMENKLLENYFG